MRSAERVDSMALIRACGLEPAMRARAEHRGLPLLRVVASNGRRATQSISRVRHSLWLMLREAPFSWSYPEIAKLFNVDHTSVMYGVRKAREERAAMVPDLDLAKA
jgi:hypothetical protein